MRFSSTNLSLVAEFLSGYISNLKDNLFVVFSSSLTPNNVHPYRGFYKAFTSTIVWFLVQNIMLDFIYTFTYENSQ